jgi:hypothetical protein
MTEIEHSLKDYKHFFKFKFIDSKNGFYIYKCGECGKHEYRMMYQGETYNS